jgi:replicative DNA helicase
MSVAPIDQIRAAKAHSRGEDAQMPEDAKPDDCRVYTVRELLEEAVVRSQMRDNESRGTTGHHQIDTLTGGLRPGHGWLVAAESSWGKSSFLISVADENLKRGKKVLIVSFEDPRHLYANRLLCRRARIDAMRLRDRRLNEAEKRAVAEVVQKAEPSPFYIEALGKPIEELVVQVRKLVRDERIYMVAWDYLQEAKTRRRYQDERVRFRETASMMRDVGRSTDCCTMILSQVTEQTGKKYPDKNSVRECRDASNAAEHILIGFTPEENITRDGKIVVIGGTKCMKIDKSKDGQTGVVALDWCEDSASFKAVMPAHATDEPPPGYDTRGQVSAQPDDFDDLDSDPRYP